MGELDDEETTARVRHVGFTETSFAVELRDGTRIARPLDWFPRLAHGTPAERNRWRLIGAGYGIHWPDLDEDISVENVIHGDRSMESPRSFDRWLKSRSVPQA